MTTQEKQKLSKSSLIDYEMYLYFPRIHKSFQNENVIPLNLSGLLELSRNFHRSKPTPIPSSSRLTVADG